MRVVFIGNVAGGAYMMARPVAARGVNAVLMLAPWEGTLANPGWEERAEPDPATFAVVRYGVAASKRGRFGRIWARAGTALSCLAELPSLLRTDVIQSFTGTLFGSWAWLIAFGILRLRPYIACATGSDLREVAATGTGYAGWLYRFFFRRAAVVLLLNLDMPPIADRLHLAQARFFPFAVDTSYFRPREVERRYCTPDALLIFMPSHLDWGESDDAHGRSSTKGNDRLVRAFARMLGEGGRGHLVLLDRGPDRAAAHRLVEALGIAAHVTFRAEMTKSELTAHLNMADVIADQFDIGAFGTITLEAMACERPVLVHVDAACAKRSYGDLPPVLSATTEDEILAALLRAGDLPFRRSLGKEAREWVVRHHDAPLVASLLIDIYRGLSQR
ncbi:MAG TPA: glycosyltransferase family 4 protein [Stellaceae bacterium]|nr:glycosyltransferase family 4 protein [Stellaceae bacterium]